MTLQPELEQRDLPEFVAAQWGQLAIGVGQQGVDRAGVKQPALLGDRRVESVADHIEVGAFEVGQRGNREITFGAIDDLGWDDPPRGFFEDALATVGDLQLRWTGGRQLDELVVKEWNPALQSPGHGHVVYPLDRVVYQHPHRVEP